MKRSKGGAGLLPVSVQPNNPAAVPIAPQFLRTAFTKTPDQIYADIANANGRLEDGVLDLPPIAAMLELFAVGLENAGILALDARLDGHQAWPLVAASLAVQGTPGPVWFVVRRCNDLLQLDGRLKTAATIGRSHLARNLPDISSGISAIHSGRPTAPSGLFNQPLKYEAKTQDSREALAQRLSRAAKAGKRLPPDAEALLRKAVAEGRDLGPTLVAIADIKSGIGIDSLKWSPMVYTDRLCSRRCDLRG